MKGVGFFFLLFFVSLCCVFRGKFSIMSVLLK